MITTPLASWISRCALLISAAFVLVTVTFAQTLSSGTIEGRIFNPRNGSFVEGARLVLEESALETFSDSDGNYRFGRVPAGERRVRVTFTGVPAQTDRVVVPIGQTARLDFQLGGRDDKNAAAEGVVQLDRFVVETGRTMDGAAIAINEQRIAANIKNVVSTDEFGTVAENNVAEFLKFVPGVIIEYNGGTARGISIDGVPPNNVPVSLDGFSVASAPLSGNVDRAAQMDIMSLNNISRVEVSYSPTPDSQGSALAGSVNMVPRSAFERPRPSLRTSVFVVMRDNAKELRQTPGPRQTLTTKVQPGGDFSLIYPVSKRFGFTLSGSTTTQYSDQSITQNVWRGVGSATSAAYAATTPDNPYLSSYTVRDSPKMTRRASVAVTFDYRISDRDRLSLSIQHATYKSLLMGRALAIDTGSVTARNFSATRVVGGAGTGTMTQTTTGTERFNRTLMPTLTWRHQGPIWKAEGGAGFSRAINHNRARDKGYLSTIAANRTGLSVTFDEITALRPGAIRITDGAGAVVDPFNLTSFNLNTAGNTENDTDDLRQSAFLNASRDFQGRVPFSLKAGLDARRSSRDVHTTGDTLTLTYAAANRNAGRFLDANFSKRDGPYGWPKIQWLNAYLVTSEFEGSPALFTRNLNTQYRNAVTGTKYAQELISTAYLRGDAQFFERRLKFTGGLRAEQTNIEAEGPLTDPSRNVQRDAAGKPILGANGRPLAITSDALATSKLTFLPRAAHAEKEYLRLFPSLNGSYNLRENLVARAAYYYSVGRPNYNQYTGGLMLPNSDELPSNSNQFTITNVGIKAWSAKSTKVRLEYYFEGVGQVSVGAFRRDFRNFFGSAVSKITPDLLATYGLDPAVYQSYDVSTQFNITQPVRIEGVDFSYKQALTFLPHWARGLQVFFNGAATHAKGDGLDSFTDRLAVPLTGNWGVSFARPRFSLHMNWNWRTRQRGDLITGASIGPDTHQWSPKQRYMDISAEFFLRKNISVYASLRNVTDVTENAQIYGPLTPAVNRLTSRTDYGALWQFGVKGLF